jgi:hypothetical protein
MPVVRIRLAPPAATITALMDARFKAVTFVTCVARAAVRRMVRPTAIRKPVAVAVPMSVHLGAGTSRHRRPLARLRLSVATLMLLSDARFVAAGSVMFVAHVADRSTSLNTAFSAGTPASASIIRAKDLAKNKHCTDSEGHDIVYVMGKHVANDGQVSCT